MKVKILGRGIEVTRQKMLSDGYCLSTVKHAERILVGRAQAERRSRAGPARVALGQKSRARGIKMNKVIVVVIAVALVGIVGCDKDKDALTKGSIKDIWTQASDKDYVRTRGIGAVPEGVKSLTQRRGLARNAALASARYELLAIIKGLKVTGGLTVGSLMQTNGEIKELADRIIAGAEEEQVEWAKDDGCVVLLRLERSKVDQIVADTAPYEVRKSNEGTESLFRSLPGLGAQNDAKP